MGQKPSGCSLSVLGRHHLKTCVRTLLEVTSVLESVLYFCSSGNYILLFRALRVCIFSFSIPFRHVLLTPRNTFTYAQLTQESTSHGFSLRLFSSGADDHKDMLNNDRQRTGSNSIQRSQNSAVIL